MSTAVNEVVDLSDLDLLDDEYHHGWCDQCLPTPPKIMEPFTAVCGRTVTFQQAWKLAKTPPPNACPDCLAVSACPRCGAP